MAENSERKVFSPQEGFQYNFARTNIDVVFGGAGVNTGKAGLLNSFVSTPFGFKMVKDLKVGDVISNPNTGGTETITQLHPISLFPFYKICFDDGTIFECSEGHLWQTKFVNKYRDRSFDKNVSNDWEVIETSEIFEFYQKKKIGLYNRGTSIIIPNCHPITFECGGSKALRPINPYILGVILSNGKIDNDTINKKYIEVSIKDKEVLNAFDKLGYSILGNISDDDLETSYRISENNLISNIKLIKINGCTEGNKFIPNNYKYSTINERKELLKGLIDSNGRIDKIGIISYQTYSKTLADDIAFIVRSLGGKASVISKVDKVSSNKFYVVTIVTRFDSDLISIKSKRQKMLKSYYIHNCKKHFERIIVNIDYVGMKEGRCITVSNPTGLYAANDFIVTHNSFGLVLSMAQPLMQDKYFRGLITRRSLGNLKSGGGFIDTFSEIFGDSVRIKQADNPRVLFPSGAYCDLTYIDDSNIDKFRERAKGWQYDCIAIDEITEMPWNVFTYIQTRNRGRSKTFTGKFFATFNPKKSHWTRQWLDWYIGADGFIIPERDGCVRYFYINGDSVKDVVWGDSKEEVYYKCKIDIDRKLEKIGGSFSYKNMIKSFVFYRGRMSENKAMMENNPDYIGSVSASGSKMSQALVEQNFNVDPEEEEHIPLTNDDIRKVFISDPAVNGDGWVTVDLADYGTDNLIAFAWNGFHIIDCLILTKSTPRDNASNVRIFAANHEIAESHIVFDATAAMYFKDYIEDAIPYRSSASPLGMYKYSVLRLKDECYVRLVYMIKKGHITMADEVANRLYLHQNINQEYSIGNELSEECAVVRFSELSNGKKTLFSKKQMNAMLGKNRSMDCLDPCAMRMLPVLECEYGSELFFGLDSIQDTDDDETQQSRENDIYDDSNWA